MTWTQHSEVRGEKSAAAAADEYLSSSGLINFGFVDSRIGWNLKFLSGLACVQPNVAAFVSLF